MNNISDTNTLEIFDELEKLTNFSKIHINGYANRFGEVSNYTIRTIVNLDLSKLMDLKKLENFDNSTNHGILSKLFNVPHTLVEETISEMIESMRTNIIDDVTKRTLRSQVQTNLYTEFSNCIKVKNDNGNIYIIGLLVEKTIVTPAPPYSPSHSINFLIKEKVGELADLEMRKYKSFKFDNIKDLGIDNNTITL